MFKTGTVCIKIAGRDAGKTCVLVEEPKDGITLIEGEVRRRKCNIKHLEPTGKSVKVKAGASHAEVMKALGLEVVEKKPHKTAEKPKRQQRVKAAAPVKKKAPVKKAAKKAETPKKAVEKKTAPEETAE